MQLSINEIIKACGGTLLNGEFRLTAQTMSVKDTESTESTQSPQSTADTIKITGITTDSRTVKQGDLFVPLAGPRFDGHAYIAKAAALGAVCALTELDTATVTNTATDTTTKIPLIKVPSTYQALLDVAAYYRRLFAVKVVAVTGSVGKTSTKEMLASVLSQRYRTRKTEGNKNNNIGLPQTIFGLTPADEVIVLEMGMNHFGEIHDLSLAARPDIAVITNIGDAHVENLGSREGVLKAKLEIVDGLDPAGVVFVNGQDPLLSGLVGRTDVPFHAVGCFGGENAANIPDNTRAVYATHITSQGLQGTHCLLHIGNDTCEVLIPQPGVHMVTNTLFAAAIGDRMGLTTAEIKRGIEQYRPTQGRMVIINRTGMTTNPTGMTILDDCYNANPVSMRAAVDVLAEAIIEEASDRNHNNRNGARRVCILGDMLELGACTADMHREVGRYVAERGIRLLITIGELAAFINQGYKEAKGNEALHFSEKAAFIADWRTILRENDIVLVKASHSMAFEEIVAALSAPEGQRWIH